MPNYHSTLSRREFMKGLGLTGAGLGAASAVTPLVHDLDELASTYIGESAHPWWVKEREHGNPTVEVDWDMLTPSFSISTGVDGMSYPGPYPAYMIHKDSILNPSHMDPDKPGFKMQDYALLMGASQLAHYDTSVDFFLGPPAAGLQKNNQDPYPDAWPDWGWPDEPKFKKVPRWSGTPEEANRMIRAAAYCYGAYAVGFLAVDDKVKKLTFADAIKWEDCDKQYYTGELVSPGPALKFPTRVAVIPNKCKWVIVLQVTQPYDTSRLLNNLDEFGRGPIAEAGTCMGYNQNHIVMRRMQAFLKVLGYIGAGNAIPYNTGAGALAGLNEIGRHALGISPTLGSAYRVNITLFTDLPVEPTPPIDAGLMRFCKTCNVCADLCPNEAINKEKEPTWEQPPTKLGRPEYGIPAGTKNTWTRYGVKHWPVDYVRCQTCPYCQMYCVFSQQNFAITHNMIKAVASNTSMFNSFFASMDRYFGYDDVNSDYTEWWDRDLNKNPSGITYAQLLGH